MGVISQMEDGHFYLEDFTASVEINLTNAISFTGIFYNVGKSELVFSYKKREKSELV